MHRVQNVSPAHLITLLDPMVNANTNHRQQDHAAGVKIQQQEVVKNAKTDYSYRMHNVYKKE